jgi:hypothetical protein
MNIEYEKYPKSFLKKFTLSILKTINNNEFNLENKEIIDSDLIPEIHSEFDEINQLNRKTLFYLEDIERQMEKIEKIPQQINVIHGLANVQTTPKTSKKLSNQEALLKIKPLLDDPSVQILECKEEEKPIVVSRYNRKQPTQISLSKEEINGILQYFSEKVHIPLINGPFHVHSDNLEIMAIYSEMTGSNFIITKENGR